MKRILSLFLTLFMIIPMLPACSSSKDTVETLSVPTDIASTEPTVATTQEPANSSDFVHSKTEKKDPIVPLEVVRYLTNIQGQDGIEPYSEYWFGDKRVNADLSSNPSLAYSLTFSNQTVFKELPAGYDPEELLEWGKYPGLNVDILHKHGFTGKGAVIAYVDQPISKHPAYANVNLHYTNNSGSNDSMHGPTVLSMLAGAETGTAPEVEVYFYGNATWKGDAATRAESLYQIIEQNKFLPDDEKITMVGFSDNLYLDRLNEQAFTDAVKACEDAGITVWFCGEYSVASFLPYSDRNNPSNAVPDGVYGGGRAPLVYVPGGARSGATSDGAYIYWSSGGLSWTMPYILGLYAIATEIDPALTQDDIRSLVKETAYDTNGMKLINPVGFIAKVLQDVGRTEEAQTMLDEVAARTNYLYAVMDTAAMSEEDLTAVSAYLADITDATVLVADAAFFTNAEELYTALQADARERGGKVAGVQIFGTPAMVPTFEVQYKVQMLNAVDDDGTFLTDLFYGNFDNDPRTISNGYNVMGHFEQDWDVDLVPQWPVARLPLSKGKFGAFFEKYNTFVTETGLQQQDLVNFSNPIFATNNPADDMGTFLNRMHQVFKLLDVPYRLYGNKLGQYPVKTATHGGFTAEELAAENAASIAEFLINTHGQWNNIDKCFYEGGKEKRESLVNMDTINSVLDDNPYYLDMWTCLNGYGMSDNLTTTALNGNCVGMFSATAIISNNGVNCRASISDMEKSNFYYFYYHYLKALHEGKTRSMAFFTAQQEYGTALIEDSINGIRSGDGNYQFNLCNLLAYHNFGVLEPNYAGAAFEANGYIAQAGQSVPKQTQTHIQQSGASIKNTMLITDGQPVGEPVNVAHSISNELKTSTLEIHSYTKQQLDNKHTRFTIEYTATEGLNIFVFNPPNGDIIGYRGGPTSGEKESLVFDISDETLFSQISTITVNFYINDNDRAFVFGN